MYRKEGRGRGRGGGGGGRGRGRRKGMGERKKEWIVFLLRIIENNFM